MVVSSSNEKFSQLEVWRRVAFNLIQNMLYIYVSTSVSNMRVNVYILYIDNDMICELE